MFKKFLSILLVLCMVCAFLPASIASAADANAGVYLNYFIQGSNVAYYNEVTKDFFGSTSDTQTKLNTITDYTTSAGFWRWADVQNTNITSATTISGAFEFQVQQGGWTALEIFVPLAGNYDVYFTTLLSKSAPKGCRFAYTILPATMTAAEITDYLSTVTWTKTDEMTGTLNGADKVFGQINCDTADYVTNTVVDVEEGVNFPNAGKYLVVMKNIEAGTNGLKNNAIVLRQLEIKNGNVTHSSGKSLPMGYTILDKTEFTSLSETATVSESKLYKSNARDAYPATSNITYASSNENVVKVSGTTVTPVGNGTAEVYAIVDGYPIPGVEVSVNLPVVTAPNKDVYLKYSIQSSGAYGTNIATPYYGTTATTKKKLNTFTDYSFTNGVWRWADVQNTNIASSAQTNGSFFELQAQQGGWTALAINVPAAGDYTATLTSYVGKSTPKGCRFAYTILPATMTQSAITEHLSTVSWDAETETLNGADKVFGQINCDLSDYNGENASNAPTFNVNIPEAGEYLLVLKNIEAGKNSSLNNAIMLTSLELKNGSANKYLPFGYTKLSDAEMLVNETATVSASDLYISNIKTGSVYSASSVSYESSDEDVVTVSDTTVTAVGEGTAEVYAVVDGYPLPGVTVTVKKYADAPMTTSLYVVSNDTEVVANSAISVTIGASEAIPGGMISSVARGTSVKVSAPKTSGNYRFKHWLGTAGVASFDAEYTFDIYTNKALLAVYEEIPADEKATVTFYKPNKEVVASKVVDKETTFGAVKPANPSLFGYTEFLGWFLGEDNEAEDTYVIDKDTEVVALFGGAETISGITVNGVAVGDMEYGEERTIEGDSNAFSYWMRGDKIVSYNKSYTFAAWQNNASFTAVNAGAIDAEVVAVLDKRGDNYVLEYEIPEGCTRLEVGIIFGSASATVNSCLGKSVSQISASRGFFTASADEGYDVAKGYVIFRDAQGIVKVVYSK